MQKLSKQTRTIIIAAIALTAVLGIGLAFYLVTGRTPAVSKQYVLENATERDKLARMMSVTLYKDGSAELGTALISSYMPPPCTYAFKNGELLICAKIDSAHGEAAFGVKNGEVIARFEVIDDNTLVFQSSSVPLFADKGARYVSAVRGDVAVAPVLTLYPGVPADPKAAAPLGQDEEGRYLLEPVITAVVVWPLEGDLTLYFVATGKDAEQVIVPFPIEKETQTHMLRIDIGDIFPHGFLGRTWVIAKDTEGKEYCSNELDVVYTGPQP